MDPNKNNVSEISIKDLCFACLKKIWIMLIVGAVLGGALFSYYVSQVKKTSDMLDITKKLSAGESDAQYELRVQKIERARVYYEMIENVNLQIDHERDYLADSIYMQIDPDNVYFSSAQINIVLENNDVNGLDDTLFAVYEREIRTGDYLNDFADELGTKPDYIKELITLSSKTADSTFISLDGDVNRSGYFYFYIYGPSREFVDKTMELVIAECQSVHDELNDTVARHTLTVVGTQQMVKMDSAVREAQIGHTNKIKDLQGQIASYNESIDSLAKELGLSGKAALIDYFDKHDVVVVNGIPTEYSERELSKKNNIKPSLQYIGIGFAAGALIVAFVVILFYIFGRKVKTQAQFFGKFVSIRKIGVMKPIYKRSKYAAFIDVKAEDDSKQSKENINKLISANYSNLTKDCNKVLITGTGDAKAMDEAVKELGLKGDFKPDIFSNPDVLKTVPDYDGVVLLEQRKVSLYKTVNNEINLISNSGTEIIGAIII